MPSKRRKKIDLFEKLLSPIVMIKILRSPQKHSPPFSKKVEAKTFFRSLRSFLFLPLLLLFLVAQSFSSFAHDAVGRGSLQFVPNMGQWTHPFQFKGITTNADIYLEPAGIRILVGDKKNNELFNDYKEGKVESAPLMKYHAYTIQWLGGNPSAITQGERPESFYQNYFLGNKPENWKSNVPVYRQVKYAGVYPGIDYYFYADGAGMKYDIVLAPNAKAQKIKMAYDGLDQINLKKDNLVLQTSVGEIKEQKPYAYQLVEGRKVEVECIYQLAGNVVSFDFPKGYDKSLELVIDPQMVFASLTGSVADNWGFSATYDAAGNLYAGGIARGAGYPTSIGALQATYGGGNPNGQFGTDCDISISKFNASGTALLYSTYLGGSGNEMPHSLVVDASNNLIIAGKTMSTNYPTVATSYDTSQNGGFDIILSKINSTGTALLGSTYVGGSSDDGVNISAQYFVQSDLKHNYGDDSRSEVIVDNAGNIYLAGNTRSTNFPVSANALKTSIGGLQDGVLLKFNPTLSTMIYGSYLGGSGLDGAYSISLDMPQTSLYVTGGTNSTDFHSSSTVGAYQSSNAGGIDGFIMRFQNSGSYPLLRSSYIGTSAYDQIYGVQVDRSNKVYIMGQTQGAFPVFPTGVYSNAGSRQFVMKLDSTLTTGIYSTVYGSGAVANVNISPVAFLVDTCENVYISGWGGLSVGGPVTGVTGMPITPTALQSTTDGADFYFIVLKKDMLGLLYGSFFGSSGIQEHVDGGTSRFDPDGVVYQAICASCGGTSAFPATPGAYAANDNGANCNLGAVKIAFNLGSVTSNAQAMPSNTGCAPFAVNFLDNSTNATFWSWNFGDGNTSSQQTPSHTYVTPGVYNVRLIASNPDACRVLDTSYVTITVTDNTITPNFNYTILDSCTTFKVSFANTSTGIAGGAPTGATFNWDFGNGSTFVGANPPIQTYPGAGNYTVKLKMFLNGACNTPDSLIKTFTFNPLYVSAGPLSPIEICKGANLNFAANATNGSTYSWNFGDGSTANTATTTHNFAQPGNYQVVLIVSNPATCNKADTVFASVTVHGTPKADFTVSPTVAEINIPFHFTDLSTGASSWTWDFGDGTTSTDQNPSHIYNRSGSYQVCLTAKNSFNCTDKKCIVVDAIVQPLADVPSGFSPNGDGNNDVFRVRGYGIETMSLKVFNRWGEQVFETEDQNIGWDGTYKGKMQEMDSYAYLLVVKFVDGTAIQKQGSVTLIK